MSDLDRSSSNYHGNVLAVLGALCGAAEFASCAAKFSYGLGLGLRLFELCLFHTADTDKTKLSCLVRVGGVNGIGDKTRQKCLVLSPILFISPTLTRQDKTSFVLSVSAV